MRHLYKTAEPFDRQEHGKKNLQKAASLSATTVAKCSNYENVGMKVLIKGGTFQKPTSAVFLVPVSQNGKCTALLSGHVA